MLTGTHSNNEFEFETGKHFELPFEIAAEIGSTSRFRALILFRFDSVRSMTNHADLPISRKTGSRSNCDRSCWAMNRKIGREPKSRVSADTSFVRSLSEKRKGDKRFESRIGAIYRRIAFHSKLQINIFLLCVRSRRHERKSFKLSSRNDANDIHGRRRIGRPVRSSLFAKSKKKKKNA